eukprot:UN13453
MLSLIFFASTLLFSLEASRLHLQNTPQTCGSCVASCNGVSDGKYISSEGAYGITMCSNGIKHEFKCATETLCMG